MAARYFGLVMAAGKSERFDSETPKQYHLLLDRPMVAHAVDALLLQTPLTRIYVVHAPNDAQCPDAVRKSLRVTFLNCGGFSRGESLRNALSVLRGELQADDWLIIHDASHPCLPKEVLRRLLHEVGDDAVGGLVAIPTSQETLADTDGRIVATGDRTEEWRVQSPQMYRCRILWDAYKRDDAVDAADEGEVIQAAGYAPKLVSGAASNIHITQPSDITTAEKILSEAAGI